MNLKTGQEKNYWIGGAVALWQPGARSRSTGCSACRRWPLSPHDPDVLYYGSQYLHRTRDKGVTWEKISPDLTAHPDCCQGVSGEPITRDVTGEEFYSTLYAIAESPLEKGVIWTGSNDGPFFVTRDNGRTWTNVTPKDMEPGGRVQYIEASPHRKGSAYYAAYRYLLGDYRPYIYATDDYGKNLEAPDRRIERDSGRHADARRARRSRSRRPAVRRHGIRHVHFVRQRRALAVVPVEPAERSDHRHQGASQGSGRRDARTCLLDSRQHHAASSAHARRPRDRRSAC